MQNTKGRQDREQKLSIINKNLSIQKSRIQNKGEKNAEKIWSRRQLKLKQGYNQKEHKYNSGKKNKRNKKQKHTKR